MNGVGGRVVKLFVLRVDHWLEYEEFGSYLEVKLIKVDTSR